MDSPAPTDLIGADARLGELIASGDAPRYHPLLAGSPAINAGNPAGCAGSAGPLPVDQRGAPRAGRCDIGAYEYTTPGAPSVIYAWEGAAQRTPPRSRYAIPFKGVVLDRAGSPVGGVTVSFTAPVSRREWDVCRYRRVCGDRCHERQRRGAGPGLHSQRRRGPLRRGGRGRGRPVTRQFPLENAGWYVSSTGDDAAACASPAPRAPRSTRCSPSPVSARATVSWSRPAQLPDQRVRLDQNTVLYGGWNPAFTGQIDRSTIPGLDSRPDRPDRAVCRGGRRGQPGGCSHPPRLPYDRQ